MSKFLVAGIIQRETIVKIEKVPVSYAPVTAKPDSIHYSMGGDAYNTSLALHWLGNSIDFLSMIGENDDKDAIVNPPGCEDTLFTDYVLPKLTNTPDAVIFCDENKHQQIFEDIKNLRETSYDLDLFRERVKAANMVVLSNTNFCRPFVEIAKKENKLVAVNLRQFEENISPYNEDFVRGADILYISDDNLEKERSFELVKEIAQTYGTKIIILGQGATGVILYSREDDICAHYNAVKTNEIINTIGAGNALFSCFLHYYLKEGDAKTAIKHALLFASYKIGFMGTSNGFLTEEEMEQWHNLIWK